MLIYGARPVVTMVSGDGMLGEPLGALRAFRTVMFSIDKVPMFLGWEPERGPVRIFLITHMALAPYLHAGVGLILGSTATSRLSATPDIPK